MAELSVRESLSETFDKLEEEEKDDDVDSGLSASVDGEEPDTGTSDKPAGKDGDEPAGEVKEDEHAAKDDGKPLGDKQEGKEKEEEPAISSKAPPSWKPTAREEWAKIPKGVQEEILRREREHSVHLEESAEHRKVAQTFQNVIRPFESIMAMENANPFAAVRALLQTAASLRMGAPRQKATMVANIIKDYEVDIDTLADVLDGVAPKATDNITPLIQKELAPIREFMASLQNMQQGTNQKTSQENQRMIDEFERDPKNEFFGDLREDMADLFDLAKKNGREMTMRRAYDIAAANHPEISKVLEQRKKAASGGTVKDKKNAGSSIHGTKGGGAGKADPGDLRGTLLEAFEKHSA